MGNKFENIDESKIIKKKATENQGEKVKVEVKPVVKVQVKPQVKEEPKENKVVVEAKPQEKKVEVKKQPEKAENNVVINKEAVSEVKKVPEVKNKEKKVEIKEEKHKEVEKPVVKTKEAVFNVPMDERKVEHKKPEVKKVPETKAEKPVEVKKESKKPVEHKKQTVNVAEKIEEKKSFPVFNVDPVTKASTPVQKTSSPVSNFNHNSSQKKSLNLNVPIDQLKRIKYETEKAINEITLDVIILNNLIKKNDEYCTFYKNKLATLKNELNFYRQRQQIIANLLK